MQPNKIIGHITCPHCGNKSATVHAEKKQQRLYYRCYTSEGGAQMQCGTVQIRGDAGQTFIKENMRPLPDAIAPTNTPADAIAPKPEETPPVDAIAPKPEAKKNSLVSSVIDFWNEE